MIYHKISLKKSAHEYSDFLSEIINVNEKSPFREIKIWVTLEIYELLQILRRNSMDILIKNGTIVDGSGGKPYQADIAVENGKITAIGSLQAEAKCIIDAGGKYVTPGFIDMHSHSDSTMPIWPDVESALGQGITTLFCGHCGLSSVPVYKYYAYSAFEEEAFKRCMPYPIGGHNPGYPQILPTEELRPHYKAVFGSDLDWTDMESYYHHLEKSGIAPNFINVVGHGQIRMQVLGYETDRYSTPEELAEIVRLCEEVMDAGAAGISFGLDYAPGWWASDEELEAVARCIAKRGKILATHYQLRPTRRGVTNPHYAPVSGMIEMLKLAEKTGVHLHLSHMNGGFGVTPQDSETERLLYQRVIDIVNEYRVRGVQVTYDTIVYYSGGDFYYPQIANRFLPYVMQAGGMQAFSNALKVGNYKAKVAAEIKAGKHPSGSVMTILNPVTQPEWGSDMPIMSCTNKFYEGKTIGELVKLTGKNYVDILLDILEEDPYATYYMWGGRTVESCWKVFLEAEDMCTSLDVHGRNYDYESGNVGDDLPKNYASTGCYGGYIQHLLRVKNQQPVEKTIKQMTANGADALGLTDRGRLLEGMAADIVVFDYENLSANEDFLDVRQRPSGIDYVLVNGEIAVNHQRHTHYRSGKILKQR